MAENSGRPFGNGRAVRTPWERTGEVQAGRVMRHADRTADCISRDPGDLSFAPETLAGRRARHHSRRTRHANGGSAVTATRLRRLLHLLLGISSRSSGWHAISGVCLRRRRRLIV
jgi:hypothetical protein